MRILGRAKGVKLITKFALSLFMPKILFVASHRPDRSPSQRFRFEQYLSFLKQNGYDYDFSWIISERDDQVFYKPGNLTGKALIFMKATIRRLRDLLILSDYDIVFVQREAFMTGSSFFEKMYAKSRAKLVFDYDDAIWLFDVSHANKHLGWLKKPEKTSEIIKVSDAVIAGNRYLADYALQFNKNVTVIPTTIDTDYHKPDAVRRQPGEPVCIGWTGSMTTVRYFRMAEPALIRIREKYGDKVRFKLFGYGGYEHRELNIKGIPWTIEREVEELKDIHIGIMPLPDDEWSKGKCGFKALQYMAMEIPPVISPVGVNTEIVQDGSNGFLASHTDEWVERISFLIDNPAARMEMGKKARQTVIDKYSVKSQQPVYLKLFNSLLENS
jgi:glycosyltransferase involved in cell wall biosynthesis